MRRRRRRGFGRSAFRGQRLRRRSRSKRIRKYGVSRGGIRL